MTTTDVVQVPKHFLCKRGRGNLATHPATHGTKGVVRVKGRNPHLAVVQLEVIVFVLNAFQESDLLSAEKQWK